MEIFPSLLGFKNSVFDFWEGVALTSDATDQPISGMQSDDVTFFCSTQIVWHPGPVSNRTTTFF